MSTRANIHFNYYDGTVAANVYRHSDGYPDDKQGNGVLPDLERFFADVEKQTDNTRFNDATYLAAKFVVWQAGENARAYAFNYVLGRPAEVKPLNFLGVGIMLQDAGDASFIYEVTESRDGGRPLVTYRKA